MRSPGRPPPRREVQRQFWRLIARGLSSEDTAVACGVAPPVGSRWFRHGGGIPPISLAESSDRFLSFAEREEIALVHVPEARSARNRPAAAPGTIDDLAGVAPQPATRGGTLDYRAGRAVEGRAGGAPSEDRETGGQPPAAAVRPRPARGRGDRCGRNTGAGPDRALEGSATRSAAGPALGHGVEPGADHPPAARIIRSTTSLGGIRVTSPGWVAGS